MELRGRGTTTPTTTGTEQRLLEPTNKFEFRGEIKMLIKSAILAASIAFAIQPAFIVEEFEITEIQGNEIWGGLTVGTGEGIYLTKQELSGLKGPAQLNIGDRIKVKYLRSDYENSVWDNIQAIEVSK